ncbi:MAG: VOC family protein [Proteobacteria bacterium]|nr:VOC family protein [Pseudomonadota bacterium]
MSFTLPMKITDVCVLVESVERAVDFYSNVLGFKLRRRAEGFADFHAEQVTLACWELDHINKTAGVSNLRAPKGAHKSCIAIRLGSPADIDEAYATLSARGVQFEKEPFDFPWNARCIYFSDPDDNVWELYAWYPEGPKHDYDSEDTQT